MCVGAVSTSRIDKGDGSEFPSDVATASLGLFIKIQGYIDSLVLIIESVHSISRDERDCH